MLTLEQRPEIIEAREWLAGNIRTTQDAEKLAAMLDRVAPCYGQFGSADAAIRAAIDQYFGPSHWSQTVLAALDTLRQQYGRLWNYAGD